MCFSKYASSSRSIRGKSSSWTKVMDVVVPKGSRGKKSGWHDDAAAKGNVVVRLRDGRQRPGLLLLAKGLGHCCMLKHSTVLRGGRHGHLRAPVVENVSVTCARENGPAVCRCLSLCTFSRHGCALVSLQSVLGPGLCIRQPRLSQPQTLIHSLSLSRRRAASVFGRFACSSSTS